MYGLIKQEHLEDIADEVCKCLGNGSNGTAKHLLLETAAAETARGNTADLTLYAGMGITQFDQVPFYDIQSRTREKHKKMIQASFDIDIDLVDWEHLRYNPLLAMIFTRLFYIKIPEAIPGTIEARAKYWKKYYNTDRGKGTLDHYIYANQKHHDYMKA